MRILPIIPGSAGEFWTLRPRRADNHPVTSSFEFPAYPAPRLSDAERDVALGQLREGAALGKLSHDTFLRRMELALVARRSEDLAVLTADLRHRSAAEGPWTRRLFGWVGRVSAVSVGVRRAWAAEKLPRLLLPHPSAGVLRVGRDPGSGLRLTHETVSRAHAELGHRDGVWVVKDLGSTNGTTVNGRRVTGSAVVRDGDQIGFGTMTFRLSSS
ncbi:peptide-binding protein [Streptomyces subrutilus]|uniref:Peptide-binding protein n=1 Tax=Streptomyces subrutilus TaxID=36818 RepID=A0A918V316_9ACTN|nr:peptide-binding protein [Streptomyces subrutilus]